MTSSARGGIPSADPVSETSQPVDPGPSSSGSEDGIEPEARPLLDGATATSCTLPQEWENERAIAADPSRDLDLRLEAYENLIDSEVGDTSMSRARNIERSVGLRQLYLKFESGNPTGTQKDRIAFSQAMDAVRRGYDTITAATCGNYGVALALAAWFAGLRCIVHVPADYRNQRLDEMRQHRPRIVRVRGDYEHAVEVSRGEAVAHEWYDANPGGQNTALQLRAYGEIAYEIYDELRDAPAAVALPVSNGTTIAGVYKGFQSLYRRGRTSRMPRMVAGSAHRKNPVVRAVLKHLPSCEDLDPRHIRETAVNEPLINWHSIDGELALESVRVTEGWAADASDRAMRALSRQVREHEGLNVLPASTAGLIALLDRHRQQSLPNDRYVAVLTGRR